MSTVIDIYSYKLCFCQSLSGPRRVYLVRRLGCKYQLQAQCMAFVINMEIAHLFTDYCIFNCTIDNLMRTYLAEQ